MNAPDSSSLPTAPTILLVDDDVAVLRMLEIVLGHAGFGILMATSSHQAIERYQRHQDVIGVVLLDALAVTTLVALRHIDPTVRCCLMSAVPEIYSEEQLRYLRIDHFFNKPFPSMKVVAEVLRRVAEAGRPPAGTA